MNAPHVKLYISVDIFNNYIFYIWTLVEYELIADEVPSAESAIAHIRREWVE
jgi:hypothetical protein